MKNFIISYIRQRQLIIGLIISFITTFSITYLLYQLPIEALVYQLVVCFVISSVCFVLEIRKQYKKYRHFQILKQLPEELISGLPNIKTLEDEQYQEILKLLVEEAAIKETNLNTKYQDMMDYYTTWVHQIKTPIASMKLQLQNEDSDISRRLTEDLFRIEQYVEMVLVYLRLDTEATDYVFKQSELDDIVKPIIRKFAGQFIRRKLRLEYKPLHTQVLTDEKWLSFVIEQVVSNALKYTTQGSITIELEEPKVLCIRDTGMGIAPENLPRIFEKGYTGYNGRNDKSASGIGLYLCKCICNRLGHRIWAESEIDDGTVIKIDFSREKLEVE